MRDLFLIDDPRADESYVNVRAPRHRGAQRARNCCDELWREFEPYASEHFLAEFPYRFHQRWFEMYLTVALLRADLEVECRETGAPDMRVRCRDGRVVWVEATAPTGGAESNPDRVVPFLCEPGQTVAGGYVPRDLVTMRISSALHAKADKVRTYRERGIIAPDDQAVVAINVRDIPHAVYDAETYGLGAAYGIGPQYVVIDRETCRPVDSGYEQRQQLLRSSGSLVDAAPFLHEGFVHVAAALISCADAANCPDPIGLDLMLLPNPNALPPYVEGQLPFGREWRLERHGETYQVAQVIEHVRRVLMVCLYHTTTLDAARNIVATGFIDGRQELPDGHWRSGVLLSDVPLHEMHVETVVLVVGLPEPLLAEYELPNLNGYRSWLVPANVLNLHGTVAEYGESSGYPNRRTRETGD